MEKETVCFTPGQHLDALVKVTDILIYNRPVDLKSCSFNQKVDACVDKAIEIVDRFINHMQEKYQYSRSAAKPATKQTKAKNKRDIPA